MLLLIFLDCGQASGLPALMACTATVAATAVANVVAAGSCKNSSMPSTLICPQHQGASVSLRDVSYAKSSYFSPMHPAKLEKNTLAEATASTTHSHRPL